MRILYLDLDSMRADRLGCYGYPRDTSPNIDSIARQGVRFENHYCSDAPCLPSRSALMSGRFGIHTGIVGHGGTAATMRNDGPKRGFRDTISGSSLPSMLKSAGLHTTYIGGFGERHAVWTFYAGFREIHDTGGGGMEIADEVSPTALDWIERNGAKDNWFLHVNYWDPHGPYRTPLAFGDPFQDTPVPTWVTPAILKEHGHKAGPHSAQDLNMYDNATNPQFLRHPGEIDSMESLRRVWDGYDTSVRYMDQHIGKLFDALRAQGVFDDVAIVISADHAENMGELGIYVEHGTADHGTCRIPLIVRWPGGRAGHVDRGLHYNLDLAPTLADLLGSEPRPNWDGASFAAAIREGTDCGRDQLVLSQCAHVCQRSVRWDNWLYMRTYHDGYHLFPEEMLFDIATDPYEQHNLAPKRPDLCNEGAHRLLRWHDDMMRSMPVGAAEDPMQTVLREGGPFHARGHLPAYLERLASTGRGEHVAELRRRHPAECDTRGQKE